MTYFATADLEQRITSQSMRTVVVSSIILVVFIALAIFLNKKKKLKFLKLPLFLVLAGTLVVSTGILIFNTVYLNISSESGGPVHWHTDVEFWTCGTELELRDPSGAFSNKIGTATYHEHNDKRIHLEGVVVKKAEDASLEKFMRVTGGYITHNSIGVPLNADKSTWFARGEQQDGDKQIDQPAAAFESRVKQVEDGAVLELANGQGCGIDETAELQAFVYRFDEKSKTYSQTKLDTPGSYVMRDESIVPPGDCLIVEFDKLKDRTDKLCRQYGVRDAERCVAFGVEKFNEELCNIREVPSGGSE